ncbi:hypothetical protein BV22DRAFT_984741, partial [Leucogyrophana mollusca]
MLRMTSSVVSGSVALRMFLPTASVQWQTTDMDIYVPRSQFIIVMAYLVHHKYQAVHLGGNRPPYSQSSIHTVATMVNGHRKVDIVASITENAIRPIFQFHSTMVMNYIAADGFFAAYPKLTSQYRALLNVMSMRDGRQTLGSLQALVKYKKRGFDVQSFPAA